jgi:hypothetical protein
MIITELAGGLGNQMFQYAIARTLALKYKTDIKFDLRFLLNRNMGSNFTYRDYDLDLFNIIPDANLLNIEGNILQISEPHFHYAPQVMTTLDNNQGHLYLKGYWQTYKYFEQFESIMRNDFSFTNKVSGSAEEMLNKIKSCNSVLINVRRTDYLNTDYHGVMGNDYINKGVNIINSKIDNPHYFIFSDDIQWCVDNIKLDKPMTIVDHSYKGDKFGYYLQLMIACKHFIIPNSTFAWWAAWLNPDRNNMVITPYNWFTDPNINTSDLILPSWMRI